MADRTWKAFERRLARACGVERIPVTGERHGADFETPLFCFQAKKRRGEFPKTVASWLAAIRATAERKGKVGVVVIQKPGGRDVDSLVVLSWKDWCALHGNRPREVAPCARCGYRDEFNGGDVCVYCGNQKVAALGSTT